MARYLLDTSALLSHYRDERGAQAVQWMFAENTAEVLTTSVSLTEFRRRLLDLGATLPEVAEVLDYYQRLFNEVVVIDADIARTAIVLAFNTSKRLPMIDALIAAAAQTKAAVLVHRNEHMRHIPTNLVILNDLDETST